MRSLGVLIVLFFASYAQATIQLPRAMRKDDRVEALRIIGFSSSSKVLSDPYPLGGYAGFEAGFSIESFTAEDLGRLGSGIRPPQQDVSSPKFSLGKGVYSNVDFFIQFTPYSKKDELAQFGGIVRWSFYQAPFLPLSASIVAHMNSVNVANQLTTRTYGFDLIGGANVDHIALFAGIGLVEATGSFQGGGAGLTDSNVEESEFASCVHTVVGANVRFSNMFVVLQIDRYTLPVFSGKIGVRF